MRKLLRCIVAVLALWGSTASAQLVDVINEVVATSPVGTPGLTNYPSTGYSTYRIYCRLQDPTDRINAVFGSTTPSPIHHLIMGSTSSSDAIWNTNFGGFIMDQINPALLGFFPEIAYDSGVTVGKENAASPGGQIFTISNPPSMIQNSFATALPTAQLPDLTIVDGAWFIVNDGSVNGFPTGADNRILLGQLTVPTGTLFYQMSISIFDEAIGAQQLIYVHLLQDGLGMVGDFPEMDGTCLGLVYPLTPELQAQYCTSGTPGCMDDTACNYDPNATEDDGSCTFPGCTDASACNYNSAAGCSDNSCTYPGCTDPTALNYNANAGCDDGSCVAIVQGCNDPSACNYNPDVNVPDNSCTYPGCTDPTALNYNANAGCDDGSCVAIVQGCNDPSACNYNPNVNVPDNSCTYPGCTDPTALNYNANAGCDDGSCVAIVQGCNDPSACNYNPDVNVPDNSCTYPGCTDPTALNYNANAGCDDGSCVAIVQGCNDPSACNYNPDVNVPDNSCTYPGCTDSGACNYDANAGCDNGDCSYPVVCNDPTACNYDGPGACSYDLCTYPGCTDPNATNFDGNAGCDDGSCTYDEFGCTDDSACNYDSNATVDDGSCTYPGCTDPTADNYNGNAGCDDGSCTYTIPGCTDMNACNYNPNANQDNGSCTYPGCTDPTADNYNGNAGCDDGSCTYTIPGCTDMNACNYNSNANQDNGSCTYPGCTDPTADNYNGNAGCDDGSCTYTIPGCTDDSACNYNPNANQDDGSCTYPGCTDPTADNYNGNAGCDDGSCTFTIPGCTDDSACNYNPNANQNDGSCTYPGCTDPSADNYNGNAGCDDGSCEYSIPGCTDMNACNYNANANQNDGSCTYPGCTDPSANNYNANAGCDDGSCSYTVPGCTDSLACNFNPNANQNDGSCTYPGCTNPSACNYNADAGCSNGSCTFPGCNDDSACNYNSNAGCNDGSCTYPGCNDPQALNYNPDAGCNDGSCEYNPDQCFFICPDDASVECGNDTSPESTGSASYQGGCGYTNVWSEDGEMMGNECHYWFVRTWYGTQYIIGSQGDNGDYYDDSCTQMIHVHDTTGPVLVGVADDVTVQCIDEVPATVSCTAYDNCADGDVTVSTFCSNTLVVEDCVLSTANGPGADWAIWLPDLYNDGLAASPYWVFVDDGHFNKFPDGTGHAFGTLMNAADNSQMLYLNMWFENQANWEEWSGMGRWYKDDLLLATPGMLYEAWEYYELVGGFSSLTGVGDWSGTALYLSHFPVDYHFGFQCGWAANNKNANFGMSGWFAYTGWVKTNPGADYVSVSGNGDLNVDKDCITVDHECIDSNNEWTCFWMATDACGNVTIDSQTVTVWDSTPPVIHNCPEDMWIECDQPVPAAMSADDLIVTDNCSEGDEITTVYVGEEVEYESECYTHIIRTYAAFDCNLNRTDCYQNIYIQDTTPPQIYCPGDQSVQCADDVVNENATATDNCDTNVEVGYWDEVYPGDCVNQFTIQRTHWAVDNCQNYSYCNQWIVVDDTTAPMFSAYNSEIWVECDDLDEVAGLEVWDNCGPVEWWTVDECLSGGCLGTIARTYHAYDLCGNYASTVLYIHVLDTTPPTIYCPAEITAECDNVPSPEELGVYAWDSCDFLCSPPFEIELNYTTSTVPGDCENSWDIYVYWSAADYCDNMGYCTTVIHVYDTTPPVFEYCPESYTIYCTDAYPSVDWAYAYDNCDEDVEISSSDNIYAGQCSGEYTIERVFRADDNCGNYTLCVQYIYVIDITPPTFEGVDEITIECDESIPYVEPTVWDDCSYPIDLTYTDSWYYYDSCYAIYLRTWVATDDCDNTSYWYQYIYIQDTTPPVIVYDEEIELPCDDFAGIYATVSDNCNEAWIYICDEVYYSGECGGELVRTYCAYDYCGNESYAVQVIHFYDLIAPYVECPEGFTVECGYGYDILYPYFWDNCDYDLSITSGYTVDDSDPCYTYVTYWWTAEDDCYNTTTCSYTVTIVDTTPPMFDYVPSGGEYSCDEEIILVPATAYDWCDEDVTVTSYQNIYPGECEQSYTIETVWVACDDCGNCSYAYTYCYVYDWYAPIWNYVPSDVTIECDDALPTDMATAYDNCDPQVSVGYYDQWYGDSCYGYWFRTFYATDDCGNTGYCYQYIYVLDTTPPVIAYDPEIELPCDNYAGIYATVSDNCNEAWIYICDEIAYSGECGGVIQRTYCAYDYCGNESYAVQIIQLYDLIAPYVECPEGFTVECGYEYGTPTPYFWDNCDYDLSITSGYTVDDTDPCYTYVTYWWTATDFCDNSTTCSYTVTIVDTTPPMFDYVPSGGEYSCDEEIILVPATAYDWCDEDVTVTSYQNIYPGECEQSYTIETVWVACDDCGNCSYAYTYCYVYDWYAPIWNYVPSDVTIECDDALPTDMATAYDNCDPQVSVGYYDQWYGDSCYGYWFRTFYATDDCGNTGYCYQYIYVLDTTPPVIVYDPEITLPCDNWEGMYATVYDNCNEAWVYVCDEIAYSGDCGGVVQRTYCAYDYCGNESYAVQIIQFYDDVAPYVECPEGFTVECGYDYYTPVPYFWDNCDYDLGITSGSTVDDSDPCHVYVTYWWTATDNCDNSTTCSYTVTIVDTTPPSFWYVPEGGDYSCEETIAYDQAYASDWCDEYVDVTYEDYYSYYCPNTYEITRTWFATDDCGNTSVAYTYFYVYDYTPPTFDYYPSDITVECYDDLGDLPVLTASDNCGEAWVECNVEVIYNDECGNLMWYVVCTAWDECYNYNYTSYYVTVQDYTAPVLYGCPDNLVLECDEQVPAQAVVTALDNCDDDVTVTCTEYCYGECPEPGQTTEQGCDLITPILVGSCQNNYDNTNWSMWLGAEADEYKYYDVVPGTGSFDQFGDGTAHLQVTLQSVLGGVHKNGGFVADIWFYNGMDWTNWDNQAFPTGFKADCGGLDAEHVNWTYYLINGDAATLTGWGSFTGSYLTLVHAPINNFFGYQVGLGANNLTANEGHGGWFNYEGWLVDSDSEYAAEIDGGGDFGFEMDCCPDYWLVREYCATDCSGNTTCCSQIITFEGGPTDWVTSPDQPATEQATATKEDFDFVAISPNPTVDRAVIDFTAKVNNTLTMEAYDAAGRKVATLFSGNVEAGQNYRVDFNTQKLEGGIYNIRLFSLSDSRVKKLIVER